MYTNPLRPILWRIENDLTESLGLSGACRPGSMDFLHHREARKFLMCTGRDRTPPETSALSIPENLSNLETAGAVGPPHQTASIDTV